MKYPILNFMFTYEYQNIEVKTIFVQGILASDFSKLNFITSIYKQ